MTRTRSPQPGAPRASRLACVALAAAGLLSGWSPLETSNTEVEEGNAKLGAGKVKEALSHYDKAAKELPETAGVHYNRGIALYRLGELDKAREALLKATRAEERDLRGRAFHNLGNAYYGLKKYKDAAAAFRRALKLNPGSEAARWNLEMALRRIKEEEQKKKKENEKDKQKQNKDKQKQNKDQKGQDDRQQQDQKKQRPEPQSKEDRKKDQQQKKKDQQQQRQQDQQQKQQQQQRSQDRERPKPKPDQQRMDAVLDALDRNNKRLQRNRARMKAPQGYRPRKDW